MKSVNGSLKFRALKLTLPEVFEGISKLKIDTGPGPDDIPNFFLENCQYAIATPLFILFNKSLSEGKLPKRWKISKITPIFKNRDKSDVKNYRQISPLNSIAELCENLIWNYLTPFFKNIIAEEQHGFVGGKSTTRNLTIFKRIVSDSLDRGVQVDLIHTNFSKSFEQVDHTILLNKLKYYGIDGSIFSWMKSHSTDRTQAVIL